MRFVTKVKVLDYLEVPFTDRNDSTKKLVSKKVRVLTEDDKIIRFSVLSSCEDFKKDSAGQTGRITFEVYEDRGKGPSQGGPKVKVVAFDED